VEKQLDERGPLSESNLSLYKDPLLASEALLVAGRAAAEGLVRSQKGINWS